jgi:hypothetical protein
LSSATAVSVEPTSSASQIVPELLAPAARAVAVQPVLLEDVDPLAARPLITRQTRSSGRCR